MVLVPTQESRLEGDVSFLPLGQLLKMLDSMYGQSYLHYGLGSDSETLIYLKDSRVMEAYSAQYAGLPALAQALELQGGVFSVMHYQAPPSRTINLPIDEAVYRADNLLQQGLPAQVSEPLALPTPLPSLQLLLTRLSGNECDLMVESGGSRERFTFRLSHYERLEPPVS